MSASASSSSVSGPLGSARPTPKVLQGGPNSNREARGAGGPDLQEMVLEVSPTLSASAWPTPTSLSFKDSHQPGNSYSMNKTLDMAENLSELARPTPTARDHRSIHASEDTHDRNSRPLSEAVGSWASTWSTPRASDGEKGGPGQSFGAGGVPLASQTALWCTPAVADVTGGRTSRSGDRKDELLLNSQAKALSTLPDPETPEPGAPSSRAGRTLNPLFVEMLMSWPPGWTLLCGNGSIDYACSATAFTLWQQRMRSALSQLVSPPEAPAQLSLFG
jgi:hypothetical protein